MATVIGPGLRLKGLSIRMLERFSLFPEIA